MFIVGFMKQIRSMTKDKRLVTTIVLVLSLILTLVSVFVVGKQKNCSLLAEIKHIGAHLCYCISIGVHLVLCELRTVCEDFDEKFRR